MRFAGPTRFLSALLAVLVGCLAAIAPASASPQALPVTAQIAIVKRDGAKLLPASATSHDASNVAVWLVPLGDSPQPAAAQLTRRPQLVQKNKSFEPHVLVVQVGTTVQFPNKDPFFHNVFSLFDGKRFDLGLYEGGSSNSAKFERPGISYLFCNIHPEMSAVVITVSTPYFAISDRSGRISISGVPDGHYLLHIWYERSSPENLKALDRSISLSADSRALSAIQVIDNGDYKLAHKNKYGQDYVPAAGPAYNHP